MDNRFTIYLMRHLPTAGNNKGQYIGWTDEPIEKENYQSLVNQFSVSKIYGSDLLRASETAEVLFPNIPYVADERWREGNFGDWEGKSYEDLQEDEQYRNWIENPAAVSPPNGESMRAIENRVLKTLYDMTEQEEQSLFVITHGGPMRILLTMFSPHVMDFWSWKTPHKSLWKLEWNTVKDFKEGQRCISLSEVPITESENM